LAFFTAILVNWVRSPATIIPPNTPNNPVNIYVVDYGFHNRLILPDGEGKWIQYAYGDWKYFALNQQDWITGAAALLLPTQGALGRRKLSNRDRLHLFAAQKDNAVLSITVEKTKVERLLNLLNAYFDRASVTPVENPLIGMTLVTYDQKYTLLHNSNHELVRWLQDLGCRVEGFVLWANFQVRIPLPLQIHGSHPIENNGCCFYLSKAYVFLR
jgi:hypothetical protein